MAKRTRQFFYDAVGNRTKVIDPDNRTTYYTYDKVNRLTGISVNPDTKSAGYYFDSIGNITKEIKPNSAVTYYEYDDAGRLTKLDNRKSDLSLISSFEYDRDKSGNITKSYRGDGGTIYYEYDNAQRLTSEVWRDSGMSQIYSYQYDYDGVGNRTKLLKDLQSGGGAAKSIYYYYDAAYRLDKEWNQTDASTTYFYYNDNGSVTEIVTSTGTTYFEYNDSDLVKELTYESGGTYAFYYDGRNQRVVIEDGSGTSYFDWDGLNPVEEYGDTDAKYIHGYSPVAGAGSLAFAKRGASYQVPHKDHIGSTRELSDASEVVTQYYEYDAFGTELEETGTETNRFQFAANYMKIKDLDNVYLSPTRVYHAGIGRFLSKDYFMQINRFVGFMNNPLIIFDPTGLQEMTEQELKELERELKRLEQMEEEYYGEKGKFRSPGELSGEEALRITKEHLRLIDKYGGQTGLKRDVKTRRLGEELLRAAAKREWCQQSAVFDKLLEQMKDFDIETALAIMRSDSLSKIKSASPISSTIKSTNDDIELEKVVQSIIDQCDVRKFSIQDAIAREASKWETFLRKCDKDLWDFYWGAEERFEEIINKLPEVPHTILRDINYGDPLRPVKGTGKFIVNAPYRWVEGLGLRMKGEITPHELGRRTTDAAVAGVVVTSVAGTVKNAGYSIVCKLRGKGLEPFHVGIDWYDHNNIIHLGHHEIWGPHVGLGSAGPYLGLYHISPNYLPLYPYISLWPPLKIYKTPLKIIK